MAGWRDPFRGWPEVGARVLSRHGILTIYLLAVAANSFVYYIFAPGYYDRNANLLVSVLALLLLPVLRTPRPFAPVVHGLTAVTLALVFYIASQTGAINSIALVWLTVLTMPVLLLLGPQATLAWIGILLTGLLIMWWSTGPDRFDPDPMLSTEAVPWAMMNHVLVLASLMLAVLVYESLHRKQLRQIEDRNEALRQTHHALIQAQAHKDEFVASVGHELRTPMNAILGFNGVLREELADRPEQLEVVEHIRRSTQHLLQVVNNILDFSQLQAGSMPLRLNDVALQLAVDEVCAHRMSRAREKGLSLQWVTDDVAGLRVQLDRHRLQQVLGHLLDNAIKFTARGGVTVRAVANGLVLRFEVEDTGPGIASDRQALIFRRFEHADVQTNRAFGGTGLGLSLCEGLVQLMGGRIGVHSQAGQGAMFWFELPLVPAQGRTLALVATPDLPASTALNILLVDDNPVNLMVARLQLQKLWPEARMATASGGEEALQWIATQPFDVALFDMIMPGMDGLELTREVRKRFPDVAARMPILALTANTHPAERERCLDAGMDEVLHKPIETQALAQAVGRLLARSKA